jgi:hypothetical protein
MGGSICRGWQFGKRNRREHHDAAAVNPARVADARVQLFESIIAGLSG